MSFPRYAQQRRNAPVRTIAQIRILRTSDCGSPRKAVVGRAESCLKSNFRSLPIAVRLDVALPGGSTGSIPLTKLIWISSGSTRSEATKLEFRVIPN